MGILSDYIDMDLCSKLNKLTHIIRNDVIIDHMAKTATDNNCTERR